MFDMIYLNWHTGTTSQPMGDNMQQNQEGALFQPIKKSQRSSELLADELCRIIIQGKIKPGESLPSERDLALKFQVTRNTVREALRSLEKLRLLSIRQGARITVLDYLTSAGFDFVSELFASSDKNPEGLMKDIGEVWYVIGLAMMFFAIDNMEERFLPEIIDAVHDFLEEAEKKEPELLRLQNLDFEIQNRLTRATENLVMILLHNSIRHIYGQITGLFEPVMADTRFMADNYRFLLESLKTGDKKGAKAAFENYFSHGKDVLAGKKNIV